MPIDFVPRYRNEAGPKDWQMDEGGQATMTDRGVAIVTGGASGIVLAIAKALLGHGWKLVVRILMRSVSCNLPIRSAALKISTLASNHLSTAMPMR